MNDDQAFKWITNKKKFIYDVHKFKTIGFSDFQFISSWDTKFELLENSKTNTNKSN